LFKRLTE